MALLAACSSDTDLFPPESGPEQPLVQAPPEPEDPCREDDGDSEACCAREGCNLLYLHESGSQRCVSESLMCYLRSDTREDDFGCPAGYSCAYSMSLDAGEPSGCTPDYEHDIDFIVRYCAWVGE